MMRWGWRAFFLFFATLALIPAQDLRLYFSLLQEGRINEVRQSLPDLIRQNPSDPGVRYLQALTVADGDSSVRLYRRLLTDFPQCEYADDAAMKIGEYLYARGLYSQAASHLRRIPLAYEHSPHIQRVLDLMVNSYVATGEQDSAAYYLARFKRRYPNLNYDYGIAGIDEIEVPPAEMELVRLNETQVQEKLRQQKPAAPVVAAPVARPWVVQVGAFGKYENANSLRTMLVQNGYQVELSEVPSNNRRLHAVRVTRYTTQAEARDVGKELNRKFGLNYLILNRPE